ncbi:MAG TPA: tetratricopeptide repeat protein, partial [Pirellulales bacterium]
MSPPRFSVARIACWGLAVWLGLGGASVYGQASDESPEELLRTGRYAECIDAAESLLEDNDRREPLWLCKLRAELALGRYEDAAETYEAGVRRVPFSIQLRWTGRDALRFTDQTDLAEAVDSEIAMLLQRAPWQFSDAANQVIVGRWLLKQGADPKAVLTKVYNELKKQEPRNVDVWLAIGDMALEKHDYQLAGEAFQQATKLDAEHPEALLGVARAFAPSDDEKAEAALSAALKINPHLLDGLLMVADAHIDAERYDDAAETLERIEEVNSHHPKAHAYRAVLAHLQNQPAKEKSERELALQPWPKNPEVDHVIGQKLSQKYRFAEGAAYQRRALEFAPDYQLAKGQLAQDLLRLGEEEEGLKLAEEVHQADAYDVFAFNLVTLQENLAKFRTLSDDGLLVRMDAKEAEVYGP